MEGTEPEAPVTQPETGTDVNRPRPSLTERLMNPQANSGSRQSQASEEPGRTQEAASASHSDGSSASDGANPITRQRTAFAPTTQSNVSVNDALAEARRFIRLRYVGFVLSMLILFAALVTSVIVLGVSLLGGASWEQEVASGAVAGTALLLLLMVQYRPAASFASAAVEIAQLEALRNHLEKSYALWDDFLEERESQQQMVANEVALAVSSMTAATRELIATQAEYAVSRGSPRRSNQVRSAQPSAQSVAQPDPRRY